MALQAFSGPVAGAKPKYIISDKGPQFWCKASMRWCRRRKIRPRFAAVGHYGSIAVAERFIRTLKEEGLRRVPVPLNLREMREQISAIACWYNACRPHTSSPKGWDSTPQGGATCPAWPDGRSRKRSPGEPVAPG
jgi:transposase InsO family protein